MRARRIQLCWLPLSSTLALVAGAFVLDLPGRAALVRGPHGAQLWVVDPVSFVAWSVGVLAVVWIAQAATDRPRRPSPLSHVAYYVAFGVLYAGVLFLGGGHGRAAQDAGAGLWWFAGVAPAAWAGRHVVSRLEDARAREEGGWDGGAVERPALRLSRSENAIWVGRTEAPGYRATVWLAPPLYVLALGWLASTNGLSVADVPMTAFLVASFTYNYNFMSAVEVVVAASAVRVYTGPLRIPLWVIPLDDLVEAAVERVKPWSFGGYGYHAKGGRRCLIVRAGPGLVLRRRARRDVVVTVGDAEEGAGLINGLIERAAAASAGDDVDHTI